MQNSIEWQDGSELERMWKGVVVSELNTFSCTLCRGTEESHGNRQSGYPVPRPRFEEEFPE
jgi:hypothetical protein